MSSPLKGILTHGKSSRAFIPSLMELKSGHSMTTTVGPEFSSLQEKEKMGKVKPEWNDLTLVALQEKSKIRHFSHNTIKKKICAQQLTYTVYQIKK